MCRSIQTLRRVDGPSSSEEVRAAALQFVRKVSGFRHPAPRNAEAFDQAVLEISAITARLLRALPAKRPVFTADTPGRSSAVPDSIPAG